MFAGLLAFLSSNLLLLILHVSPQGSFPKPLSAKEEAEYLSRLEQGDEQARQKLIAHNLRLVSHIVKKYPTTATETDDLISIGTIGLIKGINTFRGAKGTRLATYAAKCIENEILMYFRSMKKRERDVYIDDPLDTDREGNVLSLSDILSENEDLLEHVDLRMKSERLHGLLEHALDERELDIILSRYGLQGRKEETQHEIAKRLGISRSYVSRIEKKALETLRGYYE